MSDGAVLVLRINTVAEVENTSGAIALLRREFPGRRLLTVLSAHAEALNLIREKRDIDEILIFPQEGADVSAQPAELRRFLHSQEIGESVLCIGNSPHLDYAKPLFLLLLSPGKRFICRAGRLTPLAGIGGVAAAIGILWQTVRRQALARWNAVMAPRMEPLRSMLHKAGSRARVAVFRQIARFRRPYSGYDIRRAERILWIRLDHIGDSLLARPALQALLERFPGATVDAVVHPLCVPLFADEARVRQVYTYVTKQFGRGNRAQSRRGLLRALRANHYDLAIETRGDDASRVLAFLSGARRIAGPAVGPYESPEVANCSFLLTDAVSLSRMPKLPCHASDIALGILEELGLAASKPTVSRTAEPDRCAGTAVETLAELGADGAFAVIHAAPSAHYKTWRPERFAEAADHLVRKYGLWVLLTGTDADRPLNEKIIGLAAEGSERIVNGAGRFSLAELPALYGRAKLVVTVDTGPMHIAAAAGVPTVALMLPWHAPIFHPYGQADGVVCSPVPEQWLTIDDPEGVKKYLEKYGWMPLQAVSTREVVEAIDRKLTAAREQIVTSTAVI